MKKKNLIVLFSGGRTSAYMSLWIKRNWSHKYSIKYVFANTGQEHEKTLEFVNICDIEMNLDLTWIETKIRNKGEGSSFSVVDFESASRDGQPFENMVKKYGLPNRDFPHCTRELKIEPIKKWALEAFSGEEYELALGIRVDEPKRLKQGNTDRHKLYPLAKEHPMTKGDIINWWKNRHYDLQIPEHLGNCTWCWKKSDKKLWTIAHEYPDIFNFPMELEKKYKNTSNYDRKDARVMFRRYRSAVDILTESKEPFSKFVDNLAMQGTFVFDEDECAEECGSVQ